MQGNRAAKRYAKAILDLASEKQVAAEVNEDFLLMEETMEASADLRAILKSPVVGNQIKKNTLKEVFKQLNPLTSEVLEVLVKNNRINLLGLIGINYGKLFNALNNVQKAVVTSAVALTPELEQKIQAKVKELTGNEAKIENQVDPSLIGGFILRVGDLQYNASVAAQLSDLKREFKNNAYVSKI